MGQNAYTPGAQRFSPANAHVYNTTPGRPPEAPTRAPAPWRSLGGEGGCAVDSENPLTIAAQRFPEIKNPHTISGAQRFRSANKIQGVSCGPSQTCHQKRFLVCRKSNGSTPSNPKSRDGARCSLGRLRRPTPPAPSVDSPPLLLSMVAHNSGVTVQARGMHGSKLPGAKCHPPLSDSDRGELLLDIWSGVRI